MAWFRSLLLTFLLVQLIGGNVIGELEESRDSQS